MIIRLLNRSLQYLYNNFDSDPASVGIGLLKTGKLQYHDGVAKIRSSKGKVSYQQFIVDNPTYLYMPSKMTIMSLFKQFDKLGLDCISMQLKTSPKSSKTFFRSDYIRFLNEAA
ncbi:MAG: hypothetical protein M0P09_01560 [Acholeplasmataceae bacterium]|nr:hypothetical protein [Acholeplasmataceae bacterium]